MKFVFFGTPKFAAIVLEKLIEAGMPPVLVICNPDRPVGRNKIITPPPTKVIAQKHDIKVYQPEKLEIEDLKSETGDIDAAVVAAYAKILPQEVLDIPRLGTIGVHPSLLPKYRGASPIQSAILQGEEETGIALFLLDEKIDHGLILADAKLQIENRNYEELEKVLAKLGGELLVKTLPKFIKNEINILSQNEAEATFTRKFKTEDGFIEPDDLTAAESGTDLEKAEEIERKIRAFHPEPGAWTILNDKRTKLLAAKIEESKLKLTRIQIEGKKPIMLQ